MQEHAAVFRTGPLLKEGIEKLEQIYKDMKNIKVLIIKTYVSSVLFYLHLGL